MSTNILKRINITEEIIIQILKIFTTEIINIRNTNNKIKKIIKMSSIICQISLYREFLKNCLIKMNSSFSYNYSNISMINNITSSLNYYNYLMKQ